MDVEKTMQFILEQQANFAARLDQWQVRQMEADQRFEERLDRLAITKAEESVRHANEMADLRGELRRAIRFSVEEHRRERARRQELEGQ